MKLITTASELEKEFKRLIEKYNHFYWATAWASSGSTVFKDLLVNKAKIKKITVGIHFYQTHPDFIKAFLNDKKVHFIQQPEGTFHPKLYLFTSHTDSWELILGSSNFTKEAFSRNTEANILLTNNDIGSEEIYTKAIQLVEQTFSEGKTFNAKDLDKYRITWNLHRQKIKSLSGKYGTSRIKPKPIHEVQMMSRSWVEFMQNVNAETHHGIDRRLKVIEISKKLFSRVNHFSDLTEDERKFIAGIPNKLDIKGAEDWAYFGSMKGSGIFKKKIKENDNNISKALDQIPLYGQVTKNQYINYINYFKKSFTGNYIATATRLLAMKRPDTFVCFDSKNRAVLCKDFGIIQSNMDYDRYWDDIIERIYDSNWWQNPNPKNDIERRVSDARAAFLDSLYYEE